MSDRSDQPDSTNPYSDGSIPEDADFSPAGSDDSSPESTTDDSAVHDSAAHDSTAHDSGSVDERADGTHSAGGTPDALIEGNRVATASDME